MSRSWETCSTVQPSLRRRSNRSWWNCSVEGASRPAWASSSTSRRRGRTTQKASSTRFRCPPDSSLSRRPARGPQPVLARAAPTAERRAPEPLQGRRGPGGSQPKPTNSATVRGSHPWSGRAWGRKASWARTCAGSWPDRPQPVAEDRLHQRALAGPVRPHKGRVALCRELEADVVHRQHPIAPHPQALDLQHGHQRKALTRSVTLRRITSP
jgi:hypothetical protein